MDETARMIVERTRKDNTSKSLLFPCLKVDDKLVHQFTEFGFVNTYLFWDKRDYSFPVVYLVFKSEFTLAFYHFILQMEKHSQFIETIDVPETVILVYRIPKHFETDYNLFLEGKYSKTSVEFKNCFPLKKFIIDEKTGSPKRENNKYVTERSMFYHIFHKTAELRQKWLDALGEDTQLPEDMELYDRYSVTKETLDL